MKSVRPSGSFSPSVVRSHKPRISREDRYIQKLEAHIEASKKLVDYSLERFDILIISLSSGGLVFSVGFVKDLIPNFAKIDHVLLKLSWVGFAAALIVNLVTQITSYLSSDLEIKISKNLIRQKRLKKTKGNLKRQQVRCSVYNSCTEGGNYVCLGLIIASVVLLVIFIWNNI
jgi:hypothetical protein